MLKKELELMLKKLKSKKEVVKVLKIYSTDLATNMFNKIDSYEVGSWINLVNPSESEIDEVSNALGIKKNFIMSIIDDDEKPRIDEEDGVIMLLLDVPVYENKGGMRAITTLPLGILVVRNDYIVTVSLQRYSIIDDFAKGRVKEFYTYKKSRFIIQIIYRLALLYLKMLKEIDKKIEVAESNILNATKNQELLNLLAIENSLTYIITALKSNGVVLDKILKGNVIELYEEDEDLLEDAIIENNQAIEMSDLYRGILSSTTDTVATIISNNLNTIMKFLAGITIVFSIPTMVASFMGMNVTFGKFADNPYAFILLLLISLLLSLIVALILKKKNML